MSLLPAASLCHAPLILHLQNTEIIPEAREADPGQVGTAWCLWLEWHNPACLRLTVGILGHLPSLRPLAHPYPTKARGKKPLVYLDADLRHGCLTLPMTGEPAA